MIPFADYLTRTTTPRRTIPLPTYSFSGGMIIGLALALLMLTATSAHAQELREGLQERESLGVHLQEGIFTHNPSAIGLRYRHDLSMFGIGIDHRQDTGIRLPELGSGHTKYRAYANSHIRLDPNTIVSGFAEYTRGIKRNVSWNSVADFRRLYPYIVSDQKGGDLRPEQYAFGGCYNRVQDRYRYGGEMTYRALQEYRAIDPRPRSITSDFSITLGGGVLLPASPYLLTTSLSYNIYKQLSGVAIYSPKGGPLQMLMDGMGSSFRRFDSVETSLYYRSNGTEGSISLVPQTGSGISARASYSYSTLQRILSGKNETPINHYTQHRMGGQLCYLSSDKRWGATLDLDHTVRTGYDHIIGDPYGGSYPILAQRRSNIIGSTHASLSAGGEWGRTLRVLLLPTISYNQLYISHAVPRQSMELHRLSYLLPATLKIKWWQLYLSAQYSQTPLHHLYITRGETLPIHIEHLEQVYMHLAEESLSLGIAPSYTFLFSQKSALSLQIAYRYTAFKSRIRSHQIQVTTTLIF